MKRFYPSLVLVFALASLLPLRAPAQDVRSLDRHGVTLYQQGDYEGALQSFRQALEIAPNDGLTLVLEGSAFLATNDERSADDAWAQAANDDTWGSVADALSGLLRWHRGDTLDAKTWFGMCKRHTAAYPYCTKLADSLANGDAVPSASNWLELSGFAAVAKQRAHHPATPAAPVIPQSRRTVSSAPVNSANPPGAGAPPSGAYRCMTSSVGTLYQMGQIVISGSTYRYAPTGGALSAPATFSMDTGTKHLHWHGAMGALTQAPSAITDSWLERGSNFLSIIVKYKPQPNGYIFTMGCRNDLH